MSRLVDPTTAASQLTSSWLLMPPSLTLSAALTGSELLNSQWQPPKCFLLIFRFKSIGFGKMIKRKRSSVGLQFGGTSPTRWAFPLYNHLNKSLSTFLIRRNQHYVLIWNSLLEEADPLKSNICIKILTGLWNCQLSGYYQVSSVLILHWESSTLFRFKQD